MTESDIFESVTQYLGRVPVDKDEAKLALRTMIAATPSWVCVLPETLLNKLGVKYDHQFTAAEIQLAATIGGKLERRLL